MHRLMTLSNSICKFTADSGDPTLVASFSYALNNKKTLLGEQLRLLHTRFT